MSDLKSVVQKDGDHKETVSFNYPKYKSMGTSHADWNSNVNTVEAALESIIQDQPMREDYPLIHLRREETDEFGTLIRVHFDLFGKTTLVKMAMQILNPSVTNYVMLNTLESDKSEAFLEELMSSFKAAGGDASKNLLSFIPSLNSDDPNALKSEIIKLLKAGVPAANATVNQSKIADDSLTHLPSDSEYDGPLNFDEIDSANSEKDKLPMIIMPNPCPDDYN